MCVHMCVFEYVSVNFGWVLRQLHIMCDECVFVCLRVHMCVFVYVYLRICACVSVNSG